MMRTSEEAMPREDFLSNTSSLQTFRNTVLERRSVRGFLPTPISHEALEDIFSLAQRTPSNCNTQPWKSVVISGDRRQALCLKMTEAARKRNLSLDFPFSGKYESVYKERQKQSAVALYSVLGLQREDTDAREEHYLRNFMAYGAPHIAFLFLPDWCGMREAADVGMYAQTLMLSLSAAGIASCPQTCLSFTADIVRKELNISENFKLLFGIAFGYEDEQNPANRCRTERAPIREVIDFIG